jgi:hypothetical protein
MARASMSSSPPSHRPESERREPIRPGPLAGRYAPTAAMVVLFLVPYLGLSSALDPLTSTIAGSLHTSEQTLSIGYGLASTVPSA